MAVAPAPIGPLGLIVGGVGDVKTPRLAGRFADEYNVYPGSEDDVRARISLFRDSAAEAGRDPDAIFVSSSGAVLTAPTESEYRDKFNATAADAGIEPAELEAHYAFRSTPRGSHEQVAAQLAMLAGLGVERFHLQRHATFDREEEESLLGFLRKAIG